MAAKPNNTLPLSLLLLLSCSGLSFCWAEQCGSQAGGALCPNNLCCSQYGFCGSTSDYCTSGCQSQCRKRVGGGGGGGGVASIITSDIFHKFLSQSRASGCPSNGFYTYDAFMSATSVYPAFGTTGSSVVQKRELAAFFANAAHETQSGCYVEERDPSPEQGRYYGRGPLQITGRYNYETAGRALSFDGVNDPGIVARNPTVSFKTAVWYWMTQHSPTCHSAITTGHGFGATINAINGGYECGASADHAEQNDRIALYTSFCSSLKVDPGPNLTC